MPTAPEPANKSKHVALDIYSRVILPMASLTIDLVGTKRLSGTYMFLDLYLPEVILIIVIYPGQSLVAVRPEYDVVDLHI